MPSLTLTMLKQFQRPPMSLKQFMLRTEVIKLYRGFMRLRRIMEAPPGSQIPLESSSNKLHPLQLEWVGWVRSEFRLRQTTADEEVIKMMLAHGKRQLQEMERTILLATNRNCSASMSNNSPSSSCKVNK